MLWCKAISLLQSLLLSIKCQYSQMGSTFPTWKTEKSWVISFWAVLLVGFAFVYMHVPVWFPDLSHSAALLKLSGSYLVFHVQRNVCCMHFWPLSPLSMIFWQLIWKVVLLLWSSLWWITSNNPAFNPRNWATCQVRLQSNLFNSTDGPLLTGSSHQINISWKVIWLCDL